MLNQVIESMPESIEMIVYQLAGLTRQTAEQTLSALEQLRTKLGPEPTAFSELRDTCKALHDLESKAERTNQSRR